MNLTRLIGNIGSEPKFVTLQNGKQVVSITMATNEKYEVNGEERTETEWHKVVCFGKNAEIAKTLKKGDFIEVKGKNKTRAYLDKQGNKRFITEVVGQAKLWEKKEEVKTEQVAASQVTEEMSVDDDYPF